jgi:hypothetical protein
MDAMRCNRSFWMAAMAGSSFLFNAHYIGPRFLVDTTSKDWLHRTFSLFFIGMLGLSEPVLSAAERFRYEPVSFFDIAGNVAGGISQTVLGNLHRGSCLRGRARGDSGIARRTRLLLDSREIPSQATNLFGERPCHVGMRLPGFASPCISFFTSPGWLKSQGGENSGNPAYMIFLYPFLVATAAQVLQIYGGFRVATLLVALYLLPQYALLAFLNRGHGYRNSDIALVSSAISKTAKTLGLNEDNVRVYGDYTLWFAHPKNYRAASTSTIPEIQQADIYLCYPHPIESHGFIAKEMLHCADIEKLVSLRSVQTLTIRGNILDIYAKN